VVRKLVLASIAFTSDGVHDVALELFPSITPEMFAGSPMEAAYLATAPNPDDFPKLVEKLKQLDMAPYAWPERDIRAITAPTLIVLGDSESSAPRARGRALQADGRWRDGRPRRPAAVAARRASRHDPLRAAGSGLLDRAECCWR
jgi:hypothetical protein